MEYKKILVTGGTALVGSALKAVQNDYPESEFVFIGSKDCDLTDYGQTLDFIRDVKPDAIIHLAAISGGIGLSMNRSASMLRDNVLMNFYIIEAARKLEVKKTIMTLTTGMYPPDGPMPHKEECMHDGYPHESNYGSSFAKRLVDPMVKAYQSQYGMDVIGLIPNGMFGENDNFNETDAPMVPTLIRKFYEKRDSADELTVWGDGSPLREYTYAKDIAHIYMWCLKNYRDPQTLNIGTVEERSVKEIAYLIAEELGIDKERIGFDTSKPKGVFRKSTDNSKFVNLSQFKYTPFAEGLKHTVAWYKNAMESDPQSIRTYSKG